MGRHYEMQPDVVNALTGHGRKSAADGYGEYSMAALIAGDHELPVLSLVEASSGRPAH
jgi:hypothetical protein